MKKAFTLAEILITVGIIGVVAVLTVPTLMQNIISKQFETGNKVFTNKIKEALKVMNTQQVLTGYSTTEAFINEFKKHYKINNVCIDDPIECFSDNITWGNDVIDFTNKKDSRDIVNFSKNEEDWGTKIVGVQFANGTSALMSYNPKCKANPFDMQSDVMHCVAMVYDLNANATPNEYGKDLQTTPNVKNFSCALEIGDLCVTKLAFTPTPISRAECEASKKDLGISHCYYNQDYWAGAVKQCGHISKLVSPKQLAIIANYLYDTTKVTEYNSVSGTLQDSLVIILGLQSDTNEYQVWSNEPTTHSGEVSGVNATYRIFTKGGTTWSYRYFGRSTKRQAICVE